MKLKDNGFGGFESKVMPDARGIKAIQGWGTSYSKGLTC